MPNCDDSNSLKPVRRVIQALFDHDKSIYIKAGFSLNMKKHNRGKSKDNLHLLLRVFENMFSASLVEVSERLA